MTSSEAPAQSRSLRVLKPGLRTTVEDLGRRRVAIWGVPRGGAFDAVALEAANLLVGNDPGCAGLELTLRAPELEAREDVDVAFTGVDFGLRMTFKGKERALEPNRALRVPAGAVLGGGYASRGSRGWLAIGGGIEVPRVLGSRSTESASGFGGFLGRPLAAGDVLSIGEQLWDRPEAVYADPVRLADDVVTLRALLGPQADAMPPGFAGALEEIVWSVARDSDRTGVRLERASGPELPAGRPAEIEPEGTLAGAVQLPGGGGPIVLGVDGPTTGGYPKPAVVIRADLGLLARLAPAMRVRFRFVAPGEAHAAAAALRASLDALGG